MRYSLKSVILGLCLASGGSIAAQPITVVVTGVVSPCVPNQQVYVATQWDTAWVATNNNCEYTAYLDIYTNPALVTSTTWCSGLVVTGSDSAFLNFLQDTAFVTIDLSCGGGVDCNGVPGGPDQPGTPCDDGNPLTLGDTWGMNCVCTGNYPVCQASFTVQQSTAWNITTLNTSFGTGSLNYAWILPDGSSSTWAQPSFTFTAPGVYDICLTISDSVNCSSSNCDTLYVDSLGFISNIIPWYDCLGVLNGPNTPGTACNDGDSTTVFDIWGANCVCNGSVGQFDCLGFWNGPNMPGTACTDTLFGTVIMGLWDANCICADTNNFFQDCLGIPFGPNMPGTPCNDNDSLTVNDTWNSACICTGVIMNPYDCNGVLNGPDMPGTPCDDNDPLTLNDMWDVNCNCVGSNNAPCQAGFWVLQGYTIDSLNNPQPIPNELWIWNLSTGGSGTYSFLWSFGDGTSSTDPFPTHQYANGGPYALCLTIDDGAGCTSTSCDSISVDANGMYTGFTGGGGDRQSGFTINVQNQVGTGVNEHTVAEGIATWPNPVTDQLNIALSNASRGQVDVTVTDANGRLMLTDHRTLTDGRNQLLIGTEGLAPGLYLLRIANGTQTMSQRFVKAN